MGEEYMVEKEKEKGRGRGRNQKGKEDVDEEKTDKRKGWERIR